MLPNNEWSELLLEYTRFVCNVVRHICLVGGSILTEWLKRLWLELATGDRMGGWVEISVILNGAGSSTFSLRHSGQGVQVWKVYVSRIVPFCP